MREATAGSSFALERLRAAIWPPVTITVPPAGIIFEPNVAIAARDGTTLRANVFRPTGDERVPVLMCAQPYNKDALPKPGWPLFTYRLMYQTEPSAQSAFTGWEGPDPAYWVMRGYAVVNLDLRGYGSSDGVGNLLTEAEGNDFMMRSNGWRGGRGPRERSVLPASHILRSVSGVLLLFGHRRLPRFVRGRGLRTFFAISPVRAGLAI